MDLPLDELGDGESAPVSSRTSSIPPPEPPRERMGRSPIPPTNPPMRGAPWRPSIPLPNPKATVPGGIAAPRSSPSIPVPTRFPGVPPPVRSRSLSPPTPIPALRKDGRTSGVPAAPSEEKQRADNAQQEIASWESELSLATDPIRQARIHYEIARVSETILDLPRAAAHYEEALRRAPEHVPTIRGARRVMLARKNYQSALPLFDAEARITSSSEIKAALLYAKGRVIEDVLGQRSAARREYATASELDREAPIILKALEQCDQDASSWSELSRTYERIANAVTEDPKHRAALIVQRARLLETKQRETDAAIELYETALRLDPEVAGALQALKRLHHQQRRWRDLISVLHREAEQSQDQGVRTMALYRIARLHAERLGNREEALAALERAARESPDEPLVLEEMARLYEEAEKWEPLVRVLEQLVDAQPRREAQGVAERVALLVRVGQLREEKLADVPGALVAYEAALALSPTHVPTLQALGKLYTKGGDWERLVRMHQGEAEHAEEPRRRAAAHARVAEIQETQLQLIDPAMEHHMRALSLEPGYAPSFKALTRLLADRGRHRELIELYARAVDETSDKDRAITYLLKMGAIYEDALQEHGQAAHMYRRVLELDPKHLGAIHALQRATERAARWPELVYALELEAEQTRDTQQIVALLHRAGEVLDDLLGDRDAAMIRFRKVLGIEPTYVPALTSLGRIYHRAGRWDDLLELYERELELTPRGPDSTALLLKMGELCEHRIGRDDDALTHYRRAIEIDPTNQSALRALGRMLRERGQWEELVRILEIDRGGLEDPAARARAAYRVGEVWEERLGQFDRAITAYEQARDADPRYRPALDALSRLRAERGATEPSSWRKLVDDLEKEAAGSPDPKLIVAALARAGEIWSDQLGEPRRACAAFERVLEREPGHLGALLSLEALYRRLSSFEDLARICASEAKVLTDSHARVAALHELARIQETRLGTPPELVRSTYEAILSLAPNDTLAIANLERIAIMTGSRELLLEIDRRLVASSDDPIVLAAYRTRLAESLEMRGDPSARAEYRAALDADPESLVAARGLSRLAERSGDAAALADAARRQARVLKDPKQASALLVRAGQVSEEQLGDPAAAITDIERALELWPDSADAAHRLLDLLMMSGQEARAADRLSRAAQSAKSPERATELWLEVARIQADSLDNLAGAIGALNRVLKTTPTHVATLRKLAELYERDQQWNESVQLLGRIIQLAPDRDSIKDAHLRLAALWDGRLGDTSRALLSLNAVLALEPRNRTALMRLAALHERELDLDRAVEIATRLVEASPAPHERALSLSMLARIEYRRKNHEKAATAWVEAIVLEGPSGIAARALREAFPEQHARALYADALRKHLAQWNNQSPAPRQAFVELALVLDNTSSDNGSSEVGEVIDVLMTATRAIPEDPELDRMLASQLSRAGRHGEAITILRKRLAEDITRVQFWRDLGATFEAAAQPDLVRFTHDPLMLLGAADDGGTSEFFRLRPPMPARARPGSFGIGTLHSFYGSATPGPLMAMLSTLPEAFSRLFPPDLEGFGLGIRDRVTARSGHPLRTLTDRVAQIFGVEHYELYVHRVRARGVSVELSEPPSVLVPASISEFPISAQVFLLARAFANIAMRFHVVDKLTPRELEVLVASAARSAAPGFGAGLTSEDVLDDQTRRIQKALPRRSRRALEEATARYVAGPPVDFAAWVRSIHMGSARAGLIVSDDLLSSIEVLRRTERDLAHGEIAELVRNSPIVAELVRFWVSEPAIELRRRAGML